MADRIGQQCGNYRLIRIIGRGGFADVYLGEHIYMGTQAAIKVLHTQLGGKEIERFRQEASMVARLEHPHIVRVFDYGVQETTPYLILSYAPNGTLRERHPKGTALPMPTIVEYVRQLADALQYAHDAKIIHRDIKPENMLLGKRNEILLSDFGIALIAQNSHSQSVKDLAGTAAYMAPEQIEGRPRSASDQYALGVVVYEWLCGTCPFQGTFTETALQHAVTPPPSLREKLPGLSDAIEQVVMTALAKDPTRRFPSIQAFAHALEQASHATGAAIPAQQRSSSPTPSQLQGEEQQGHRLDGNDELPTIVSPYTPVFQAQEADEGDELPTIISPHTPTPLPFALPSTHTPVSLTPPGPPVTGGVQPGFDVQRGGSVTPLPQTAFPGPIDAPSRLRTVSRGRLILLLALALIVIGGGIGGTIILFQRPGARTQTLPVNFQTAIANLQSKHRQAVNTYNQAVALNGTMFGFDAQHTHTNPYEAIIGIDNINNVKQVWVAATGGSLYFSSPVVANGTLYIGSSNGKLYAFDAITGQQRWVAVAGNSLLSSAAVANGLIYVGSYDHKLYAFDVQTGQEKWAFQTGDIIYSSPTVVNGLIYIGSSDHRFYALDPQTGQKKWIASIDGMITYSSPSAVEGLIYVGSSNGKLYAFDAQNGQQQWASPTGASISSSPTVSGGAVYVGSSNGKLYAFDARTGRKKWTASTQGQIFSSPSVANGLIYVGSWDYKLYAFDARTGQKRWADPTGNLIESSPFVANGLVYVGSWDHRLYVFDAYTGQLRRSILLGDKVYSSPIVANGVIYVGDANGKIYAFSLLG